MKIIIFGGTNEGRRLSYQLADMGFQVTVSVATDYGRREQGDRRGITVVTGRLEPEGMIDLIRGCEVCVDATHPYAETASANIKSACEQANVPYKRLKRKIGKLPDDCVVMDSVQKICAYLEKWQGNIMITTGSKDLSSFAPLGGNRLFPRVLPSVESIEACQRAGIPNRNIIAMQGPFSMELNLALICQYAIKFVVTKDSGNAGGFDEKIEAARQGCAELIVLRPPADDGEDYDDILKYFRHLCLSNVERR